MKRITLAVLAVLAALALPGKAAETAYTNQLVNETGLAYSNTYSLDLDAYKIDALSMQAVYSTVTYSAVTFTDGRVSTATVTVSTISLSTLQGVAGTNTLNVASNVLGPVQATNTLNVSTTTGLAGATITLNGGVLSNPKDWAIVAASSVTTAANIAAAINAMGSFTATSSGSTVTITAGVYGTAGNSYTLSDSTPTALIIGSTTSFTGGAAAATFTLNGRPFTAGLDFAVADVSSNTALNIKALINSVFSEVSSATTTTTTNTITCVSQGTACNSYTLTATGNLTAGGATFSGGQFPAFVSINGTTLTEGVDWTYVATATGVAKAISDAIMANSTLNQIVRSTWSSTVVGVSTFGVVNATTTAVGAGTTYVLKTNKPTTISFSSNAMAGGSSAAWTLNSGVITKASHGLTLGLPVLYSTGAVAIGGLTNQTTYYALPVDANSFKLATTSTGALAGSFITLTSSSTVGPHTYTLTPLAFTGTPSWKWQVSQDGTNWTDFTTTAAGVTVSSTTFASPYTASSVFWDFGSLNARYLRLKIVGPTTGGLNIVVAGYGKRYWR